MGECACAFHERERETYGTQEHATDGWGLVGGWRYAQSIFPGNGLYPPAALFRPFALLQQLWDAVHAECRSLCTALLGLLDVQVCKEGNLMIVTDLRWWPYAASIPCSRCRAEEVDDLHTTQSQRR